MSDIVLSCRGVIKGYKKGHPVLNGLDLDVPAGKIFGLLGPNGCGKSTLIKLISGLLIKESGSIKICDIEQGDITNGLVSYLPERPCFNFGLKVIQIIDYYNDFFADFDKELALKMISDLSIDKNATIKTLSKGTKEKVQLVLVMARRARLYLLDEPIAGVDPAARDYILGTIIGSYNQNASVLITTHLIHDIEPVLDEFAFMSPGGVITHQGDCDQIRQGTGKSIDELFREVFRC
ncbi:MAG: ABC transporter ATP-binding protein [Clostridia bacterium]|nr:ABC transporter ATP-binding protein [Clostridia bacterium]